MKITASAEGFVGAPASRVYAYIADFRQHHSHFLPPEFSNLVVEQGGVGVGTVVRFTLRLGGRSSTATVHVDEPEPGRVLTETEPTRRLVTKFTVDHGPRGTSRVRIETTWEASGMRALIERSVLPRMLKRLYAEELRLLDAYARERSRRSPRILATMGRGVVVT